MECSRLYGVGVHLLCLMCYVWGQTVVTTVRSNGNTGVLVLLSCVQQIAAKLT